MHVLLIEDEAPATQRPAQLIKAVNVDDILLYSKEKATFCTTGGGRNYYWTSR